MPTGSSAATNCSTMCGATRTILRPVPWTTTFLNSARNWRGTHRAQYTSALCMAWDTNSSADSVNPSPEPGPTSSRTEPAGALLPRLRLRTRFLLSMLLITTGLTSTSLLLVQRSIRSNVRQSIAVNLRNSVAAFQDFRHERETMLTSDVALLADLPITRAIMGSPDPVTIQDASQDISQIAASDLFVLADHRGRVVALHTKTPGFTRTEAEKYFQQTLEEDRGESSHWWLGEHHLYQTFIEPLYRGTRTDGTLLGFLVIGYEINDRLAAKVSKVAGSEVAFSYGNEIVATTLP